MAKIKGLKSVRKALKEIRGKHAGAMERGLKNAGAYLLAESMKIVPVDTGNLRGSSFVRASGKGFRTAVSVGYTAAYAIYVHEDLELRHGKDYNSWYGEEIAAGLKTSRGPDQQAKFLEQPARTKRRTIAALIRQEF